MALKKDIEQSGITTPRATHTPKFIMGDCEDAGRAAVSKKYSLQKAMETIEEQSKEMNLPSLIVTDTDHYFLGIMTQKDIQTFLQKNPGVDINAVKVEDVYNKTPKFVITTGELETHVKNDTDPFECLPPSVSFMPLLSKDHRFVCFVYNLRFYKGSKLAISMDIADACQLRCSGCPRGIRKMKNSANVMSLSTYKQVLKKAKELEADKIDLFNWSEPFLVENLYEYVEMLRDFGFTQCQLSSNLSLASIPNFDKFLKSGFTHLYVSVSGFTQETYEKNHRGGNIEFVKRNLEYAARYLKANNIDGKIFVRYLNFGYNANEIELFEEYAKSINVLFENRKGIGFNGIDVPKPAEEKNDFETTSEYLSRYHEVSSASQIFRACGRSHHLVLDYNADAYLCCAKPNMSCFLIGNFLEDSIEDIMINRYLHPYCKICKSDKTVPYPENVKQEIIRRMG